MTLYDSCIVSARAKWLCGAAMLAMLQVSGFSSLRWKGRRGLGHRESINNIFNLPSESSLRRFSSYEELTPILQSQFVGDAAANVVTKAEKYESKPPKWRCLV